MTSLITNICNVSFINVISKVVINTVFISIVVVSLMFYKPNSVPLNKNYFYLRRIADREGAHARVLLVEVGVVGQLVDVEVILLPVSEIRETPSTSIYR